MKRILVFPCGSEVALEIYRSMSQSIHFELVGASSVDDHGRFVFENYIGGVPFHTDPNFIEVLKKIVAEESIDGIFPAMDSVAKTIAKNESELGCVVIGSPPSVTSLCASKVETYQKLESVVSCPKWTVDISEVNEFPVFIKPVEGYGSRNTLCARNRSSAEAHVSSNPLIPFVFCENLPGEEYTIDCFSNSDGELLFHGARKRARISNGISVSTMQADTHLKVFEKAAKGINSMLRPRGAWFFQMKEASDGRPKLLEVAARLGGSSSYFRAKGINFALLTAFDAFGASVDVEVNDYTLELDRALGSKYKANLDYDTVYVDFDDCLVIGGKVNVMLVGYIYQAVNNGKKVVLITRHDGVIGESLKKYRLDNVFDEVVHILDGAPKGNFIDGDKSIFIDDSFSERISVKKELGIPVFSPDMIEVLLGGEV